MRASKKNWTSLAFSAFCFESANHGLLSAVQGTINAIVEQFIKHQTAVSNAQMISRENCLKGLTVVDDKIKTFCREKNVDFFFSRFKNFSGQCFASISYSRIGNNLGDCLFQLTDGRFCRVETYFSCNEESFAVGRAAKNVIEVDILKSEKSNGIFLTLWSGIA